MALLDVDASSLQVGLWPMWHGFVQMLTDACHCSTFIRLGELLQHMCNDNSTINVFLVINISVI